MAAITARSAHVVTTPSARGSLPQWQVASRGVTEAPRSVPGPVGHRAAVLSSRTDSRVGGGVASSSPPGGKLGEGIGPRRGHLARKSDSTGRNRRPGIETAAT